MQEALLHLWRTEHEQPNQRTSWYLQSCRFHLQHYLEMGRSADSMKRRGMQVVNWEEEDGAVSLIEQLTTDSVVVEHASVRDIVSNLSWRLRGVERAVLDALLEGHSVTEVARKLDLSYPTVVKYRRKIARLSVKLGIIFPRSRARRELADQAA